MARAGLAVQSRMPPLSNNRKTQKNGQVHRDVSAVGVALRQQGAIPTGATVNPVSVEGLVVLRRKHLLQLGDAKQLQNARRNVGEFENAETLFDGGGLEADQCAKA